MPKNKQFWSVRKVVAKIAGEYQLNLSHRALHRVTNAYMQQVQELDLGYDPKTYADPTGERAVRDWFAHWLRDEAGLVAA